MYIYRRYQSQAEHIRMLVYFMLTLHEVETDKVKEGFRLLFAKSLSSRIRNIPNVRHEYITSEVSNIFVIFNCHDMI